MADDTANHKVTINKPNKITLPDPDIIVEGKGEAIDNVSLATT